MLTKYPYNLFVLIFLFLAGLVALAPYQIIDPDSVEGFRALQGWKATGNFNCIIQPEISDISKFHASFLTWWSPGQYLFPYFVLQAFHLSLGHAIVVLNFIAIFGGLAGFYKLFRFYQFPNRVVTLSLLLILFSQTVLFRFILYAGGDTFSFLFFPWLTFFYVRIKKKNLQAALVIVFLIAGFLAKSQMLIALIPFFLVVPLSACRVDLGSSKASWQTLKGIFKSILFVAIAFLISLSIIYVFFLSKGINPANPARFNPSLLDTFTPLASPVTAIGNTWSVFLRAGERSPALQIILLMASTALVVFIFIKSDLKDYYTRLALLYYIICCGIFISLYYMDAHIDYDVRHQKFIAYLFFPLLVTRSISFFSFRKTYLVIALLALVSMVNHFRLCKVWFKDAYLTEGDFRLSGAEFPQELYKAISPRGGLTLFFSELPARWAIDRWDIVCVNSGKHQVYSGHGNPVWYVVREGLGSEEELKQILPDYHIVSSRRIGEYMLVGLE